MDGREIETKDRRRSRQRFNNNCQHFSATVYLDRAPRLRYYASAFLSWYCSASAMAIETSVCRPAFIRTTLHTIGSAFLLAAFMMSSKNCETSGTLNTEYLAGWG